MSRGSRLALAAYPPSWRERYGAELAELSEDQVGVTRDLLVGAARAWLRPAGPRSAQDRKLSTICTAHVAWCAAFVGSLVFVKQVNDPPLPGVTTGWSQPFWGLAKASFFLGWVVLLLGGTGLLLRVAVEARRRREWAVLRPMLPASALLVLVLGGLPFLTGSDASTAAVLVWLLLGLALVVAGAIGPAVSLRRSGLDPAALQLSWLVAGVLTTISLCLALSTVAQAAVLSSHAPSAVLAPMWGGVLVVCAAALASGTSLRRSLAGG
ncbi:MAG: hypothetical protein JWM40_2342 [Frankiales bacterium]|nr:hypothetical protein [Frankiales bacterium]